MSSSDEEEKRDSEKSDPEDRDKPTFQEEYKYLNLLRKVIYTGTFQTDFTGNGNFSLFGEQMKFTLKGGLIPILTTRKLRWRNLIEELLWIVRGSINSKELAEKKVHIWDFNGSREFLNAIKLKDRMEGDLGPVWGFQWRHYGAKYIGMNCDYANQGIDQLKNLIDTIRNNPDDQKTVMIDWNPVDEELMAVAPRFCLAQFYVANRELSCHLYQGSAEMSTEVPMSMARYALLTHMVAHVTKLEPKELIITLGHAHIITHLTSRVKKLLKRKPRVQPRVIFVRDLDDITQITANDIVLAGYIPHPRIDMDTFE